jgi:hypothetical protein
MKLSWYFIHTYLFSQSDALKQSWKNIKLKKKMQTDIVEFRYKKADGTIRQAFGTLRSDKVPALVGSGRKHAEWVRTYYDVEKEEWRSFKLVNLL